MRATITPALLALLLPMSATAQQQASTLAAPAAAPSTATQVDAEPRILRPFVASYAVYKDGKPLGEAMMQLVPQQPPRWRVDLVMHGTRGMTGFIGINAEQSSVFDDLGDVYRPVTQATVNKSVFTRNQTIGIYDWSSRSARWQGDLKESRRRPLVLQDGDMTGLLINLAVIRDAEPGKTLEYRFVDDGRIRDHRYVVAAEPESITVAGTPYNALKATRSKGNEETLIWVVNNVPSPIRMLKREDGKDVYDLRLVEYKGVE